MRVPDEPVASEHYPVGRASPCSAYPWRRPRRECAYSWNWDSRGVRFRSIDVSQGPSKQTGKTAVERLYLGVWGRHTLLSLAAADTRVMQTGSALGINCQGLRLLRSLVAHGENHVAVTQL